METPQEKFHRTLKEARESETKNQSAATQNKKWKAFFAAEQELKALGLYF